MTKTKAPLIRPIRCMMIQVGWRTRRKMLDTELVKDRHVFLPIGEHFNVDPAIWIPVYVRTRDVSKRALKQHPEAT